MRRFYQQATFTEIDGGFQVLLDAKPVRTPSKAPLVLRLAGLAGAIAAEWQAQDQEVLPGTMPLMQLASTTIDLTARQRPEVIDQLAAYAATDLLCYRVANPADLVARENLIWQPLLDWAALRFNAALLVHVGVMPCSQPEGACRALRNAIESRDDWMLTALQSVTTGCGSLVIGLALIEGRVSPEEAFEASQLHENFQIEQWGADEESGRRQQALKADIMQVRRFIDLYC
ncbi:MAG: ATP12 family protein [Rhodospirillaceae bacterium]